MPALATVRELRERRAAKAKEARTIADTIKTEDRQATAEEREKIDALLAECDGLDAEIRQLERLERIEGDLSRPSGQQSVGRGDTDPPRNRRPGEFRTLSNQETLADYLGAEQRDTLHIGRVIQAVVTGRSEHIDAAEPELRALGTMPGGAGGFTVPESMSATLLDRARNQTVVMRAGAATVPMTTHDLVIPELLTDPSCEWVGENQQLTDSEPTFGQRILQSRTLACLVKMSVQLFEDSPLAAQATENAIAQAVALELDRAALFGVGAALEPLGLDSAGINTVDAAGALAVDHLSEAVQLVQENNGLVNGLVTSPAGYGVLDRKKDGEGAYLYPGRAPSSVRDLPRFVSNQVPTDLGSGDKTAIYVGDWSQLLIGMRTTMRLEISRDAGFDRLQVWIRAYLRGDVAILRPTHFTKIENVQTS